jgi:hypothetical protein
MIKKLIISLFADEDLKNHIRDERADQKAVDEIFYLDAQVRLRKRYQAAFDKNAQGYHTALKRKLVELRKVDTENIKKLKEEIRRLQETNDRYLQAVAMVAPAGHKLQIHHAKMVEDAKETAMQENRRYARIAQQSDELDSDMRNLLGIMPKLQNLLKSDLEE